MKNGKNQDEVNSDMVLAVRRVFDSDNKGFIYTADLRFIILNMDCSIPRDELNELIIGTNLNQDKKISLQGKTLGFIMRDRSSSMDMFQLYEKLFCLSYGSHECFLNRNAFSNACQGGQIFGRR